VLSTAGGLVFQGNGSGFFRAYHAHSGAVAWESEVGTGIMAPPISYAIDGEQYVAVLAGIGGSLGAHAVRFRNQNDGRILAWKLGGTAALPAVRARTEPPIEAPRPTVTDADLAAGRSLYANHCMRCHGIGTHSSGLYPDLRYARREVWDGWNDIVLGGARTGGGMASFADVLDPAGSAKIRDDVASRAHHAPTLAERAASWLAERACVPTHWVAD
jgi:mono/diheme cytochrome c family protein